MPAASRQLSSLFRQLPDHASQRSAYGTGRGNFGCSPSPRNRAYRLVDRRASLNFASAPRFFDRHRLSDALERIYLLRLRFGQKARLAGLLISPSSQMAQSIPGVLCRAPWARGGLVPEWEEKQKDSRHFPKTNSRRVSSASILHQPLTPRANSSRVRLLAVSRCQVIDSSKTLQNTAYLTSHRFAPEQVSTTTDSNRSLLCFSEYIYAVSRLSSDMKPLLFDATLPIKSNNHSQ